VHYVIRLARASDACAIAAVHVASWEGSYRGILPDEEFEKRPLTLREQQWSSWLTDPRKRTLVACDPDGVVQGFAGATLLDRAQHGYDSYLATLYLRPQVKRRGMGRALLRAIASELTCAGARNMALRTLRLNTARQFYERLGARLVPEGMAYEAGHFDDVVYVFDDIARLVDLSPSRST
jgi:GNAT superfamily N-acetyltransferase